MALTRLLAAAAAAGLAAAQTSYAPATTSRLLAGAGEDTVLDTVFDGKLMIMHMPKSGGTTFRGVVSRRARSMTKSLQTYYGISVGFDHFDQKHPADGLAVGLAVSALSSAAHAAGRPASPAWHSSPVHW